MSNNKQNHIVDTNKMVSSVEWLLKEINQIIDFIPMNKWEEIRCAVQQAKAIEKQNIKHAFNQGYRDGEHDASDIPLSIGDISEYNNAEIHYNQTYGGNK